MTGVGASDEPPEAPERHLCFDQVSPEKLAGRLISRLEPASKL